MLGQFEAALYNAKSQNHQVSLAQIGNIQQIVMAINTLSKVIFYASVVPFMYLNAHFTLFGFNRIWNKIVKQVYIVAYCHFLTT